MVLGPKLLFCDRKVAVPQKMAPSYVLLVPF